MPLALAILAVIVTWRAPVGGPTETADDYRTRLGTIARAWAMVARDVPDAAAGVTLWRAESRFRLDVHAGTRTGDHGRARCLGSVHPWASEWTTLTGVDEDATVRCARATLTALRSGLAMCARGRGVNRWAYAYEYYARGHCAEPGEESRKRAHSQAILESALWVKISLDARLTIR